MPIQTVFRNIEFAADEPLREWRFPVEHFFPRGAPEQLTRFASPEFGGLSNRLSIHSPVLSETFDSRLLREILRCFKNALLDQVRFNVAMHEKSLICRRSFQGKHGARCSSERLPVATALWAVNEERASVWIGRPTGPWLQISGVKEKFGRRPLRLGRLLTRGPLYFVTFCTHQRRPFLARDEVHAAFVLFAEREFNIGVGRYVIMPDHVHLFVRGGEDFRLGRWVGLLKQALAKASNLPRAKIQVWQEGFFDHVLRSDESWNYVRENPMRAGLIKSAEEWPYQGEIVYIDRA
jgi:REP element-mobilizing transposase RayT